MQADWEFEVGGDAPVIDALWPGFVDLRLDPARARELPEALQLPGLSAALERLNAQISPVWTSKCDFWPELEKEEFDPDELDASLSNAAHAVSCYLDLLPLAIGAWANPGTAEATCRRVCGLLGPAPLHCCRADLVVRRALIVPNVIDLGITAYLTACGPTPAKAIEKLQAALGAFVDALCPNPTLQ